MEKQVQISQNTKVFKSKLLGKGSFGTVYKGLYQNQRKGTPLECAIKFNHSDDEMLRDYFRKECEISMKASHPNLIASYESGISGKDLYLVIEFAPNGSLLDYLNKLAARRMTEDEAKVVTREILDGLAYLHEQGIIHRDLKLENILLSKHMKVKIADFGFAKKQNSAKASQQTILGTPSYVAPEIAKMESYNFKVDIFAFGMLVYALVFGDVVNPDAEFKSNLDFEVDKIKWPKFFSPELIDFLRASLHEKPLLRASAKQLMNHPWLTGAALSGAPSPKAPKKVNESKIIFNGMLARDPNKLKNLEEKVFKKFEFVLNTHLEKIVEEFLEVVQDINWNLERNEPELTLMKEYKYFPYLKLAVDLFTVMIYNIFRTFKWSNKQQEVYLDLGGFTSWFSNTNDTFEKIYSDREKTKKKVLKSSLSISHLLGKVAEIYKAFSESFKSAAQSEWVAQLRADFNRLLDCSSGLKIEYGIAETGPSDIEGVAISPEEWTQIRTAVLNRISTCPKFTIEDTILSKSETPYDPKNNLDQFLKVKLNREPNLIRVPELK